MAYLTETSTWEEGVYQLEITDRVLGGPNGVSNKPLKDLANRTKYLYDQLGGLWSVMNGRKITDFVLVEDYTAGTELTLPNEYEVGGDCLGLFCEAVGMIGPTYFSEVGEAGNKSNTVTLTFDLPKGMVLTEVIFAAGTSGISSMPDDTMPILQQALADIEAALATVNEVTSRNIVCTPDGLVCEVGEAGTGEDESTGGSESTGDSDGAEDSGDASEGAEGTGNNG